MSVVSYFLWWCHECDVKSLVSPPRRSGNHPQCMRWPGLPGGDSTSSRGRAYPSSGLAWSRAIPLRLVQALLSTRVLLHGGLLGVFMYDVVSDVSRSCHYQTQASILLNLQPSILAVSSSLAIRYYYSSSMASYIIIVVQSTVTF